MAKRKQNESEQRDFESRKNNTPIFSTVEKRRFVSPATNKTGLRTENEVKTGLSGQNPDVWPERRTSLFFFFLIA